MDRKTLVEQITRGVAGQLAPHPSLLAARRAWLLYTEDSRAFSDALAALGAGGVETTVVVPRWAIGVLEIEGATVLSETGIKGRLDQALAAGADALVLPSVPRSLENQLSLSEPEAFAARVVKSALGRGFKVLVTAELSPKLGAMGLRSLPLAQLLAAIAPAGAEAALDCRTCPVPGQCATRCASRVEDIVARGALRVSGAPGLSPASAALAAMIDHTLLKPDASEKEIRKLCEEARKFKFASVCVNPHYVALSAQLLKGSGVMVCTVVGFPLGATPPQVKAFETQKAIADGADEIDMVLNVGALKSKDYALVEEDIRAVVKAASGHTVKVILETSLLTDEEKVAASALSKGAGADFVKTSTGFGGGGATEHDIALMRQTVGPELGVKASGGVRDTQGALAMIRAGATRIGASASVAIVGGGKASGGGY